MPSVIVIIVLALMAFGALVGWVLNLNPSPEEHRQRAVVEARAATRETSARRATGHAAKSESNSFLADEQEHQG